MFLESSMQVMNAHDQPLRMNGEKKKWLWKYVSQIMIHCFYDLWCKDDQFAEPVIPEPAIPE